MSDHWRSLGPAVAGQRRRRDRAQRHDPTGLAERNGSRPARVASSTILAWFAKTPLQSPNVRARPSRATAFTVVELLVVIAILATLLALLLPAVQSARESARRTQCQSHLKQLGLSCLIHEQSLNRYPTGGWGYMWIGDPDAGVDSRQPGGWVFNVLPYHEQQALHDLATGLQGTAKQLALAQMNTTALTTFNCPSRRAARGYPLKQWTVPRNSQSTANAAKTDYAANGGDGPVCDMGMPTGDQICEAVESGVIYQRSAVTVSHVTDGTSSTYLLGEKYMNADSYTTGTDNGDDQSMYVGYDLDVTRWTRNDPRVACTPLRDTHGLEQYHRFGSTHAETSAFVFCDGSVRSLTYQVDPEVHRRLGNRADGLPTESAGF